MWEVPQNWRLFALIIGRYGTNRVFLSVIIIIELFVINVLNIKLWCCWWLIKSLTFRKWGSWQSNGTINLRGDSRNLKKLISLYVDKPLVCLPKS